MSRRLVVALAATLAAAGSVHAQTAPPAWITRSDANSKILLDETVRFSPESASQLGVTGYDDKVADLKPGVDERSRAALVAAKTKLQALLATEKDVNVRQDLQILIKAADGQIEGIDLNDKYMLPYNDVGQLVFDGEFGLLKDDAAIFGVSIIADVGAFIEEALAVGVDHDGKRIVVALVVVHGFEGAKIVGVALPSDRVAT